MQVYRFAALPGTPVPPPAPARKKYGRRGFPGVPAEQAVPQWPSDRKMVARPGR